MYVTSISVNNGSKHQSTRTKAVYGWLLWKTSSVPYHVSRVSSRLIFVAYLQMCLSQIRAQRFERQSPRLHLSSCRSRVQSCLVPVYTIASWAERNLVSQSWFSTQRHRYWSSPALSSFPRHVSPGNATSRFGSCSILARYAAVGPWWQYTPPSTQCEAWRFKPAPAWRSSASCSQRQGGLVLTLSLRSGNTQPSFGVASKGVISFLRIPGDQCVSSSTITMTLLRTFRKPRQSWLRLLALSARRTRTVVSDTISEHSRWTNSCEVGDATMITSAGLFASQVPTVALNVRVLLCVAHTIVAQLLAAVSSSFASLLAPPTSECIYQSVISRRPKVKRQILRKVFRSAAWTSECGAIFWGSVEVLRQLLWACHGHLHNCKEAVSQVWSHHAACELFTDSKLKNGSGSVKHWQNDLF